MAKREPLGAERQFSMGPTRGERVSISPTASMEQKFADSDPDFRFAFGKNWQRFLRYLKEERIAEAEKSLQTMLEVDTLRGKSFVDVGCGSGLFSLASIRLGAARVHSFDYDPQSVACTKELKDRYFSDAENWKIEHGSVLDRDYLSRLGQFDAVYSWGVLHHTGNMWQALENVVALVASDGRLFISLYNDQDFVSGAWRAVKRRYNRGFPWRWPIIGVFGLYFMLGGLMKDVLVLRRNPLNHYREYKRSRGMSYFPDLLDWLGGYPFEVAKPEDVFNFFRAKGFELLKLKTVGGRHGNNEFVFKRQ
jgi:2-polyprenyl-6-hydroxyphenyl methylase/3-demethylubiquinone-9 3-methyltransferase